MRVNLSIKQSEILDKVLHRASIDLEDINNPTMMRARLQKENGDYIHHYGWTHNGYGIWDLNDRKVLNGTITLLNDYLESITTNKSYNAKIERMFTGRVLARLYDAKIN